MAVAWFLSVLTVMVCGKAQGLRPAGDGPHKGRWAVSAKRTQLRRRAEHPRKSTDLKLGSRPPLWFFLEAFPCLSFSKESWLIQENTQLWNNPEGKYPELGQSLKKGMTWVPCQGDRLCDAHVASWGIVSNARHMAVAPPVMV